MGAVWLNDLPDILTGAGLDVDVYDGWETRSRSSGGYDAVWGIGLHHDASSTSTSLQSACDYGWRHADDRPIGAIRLGRGGEVVVGAAGATNTQGKGGPLDTSRGTIPLDAGNRYMISIEPLNNGVGEAWPAVQLDAYIVMVAALCDAYGLHSGDVYGHHGYCAPSCPGRKIDPAGPTPKYPTLGGHSGAATTWDDDDFRDLVDACHPLPPPSGDDDMTSDQANQLDQVHTIMAGAFWPNRPDITNVQGGELATRIRRIEDKLDDLIDKLG